MTAKFTNDRATQILIYLLKANGIRKVVVSPGTTNLTFVASLQYDSFFELYSAVDERSAGYIACGMAMESQEPVVLTCTEATASRNYFSAMTEAFYRKLPILVVTGTHGDELLGHLHAQSVNRSRTPVDTVKYSISIGKIRDSNEEWSTITKVNTALLELKHRGEGVVHINLQVNISAGFTAEKLKPVRVIKRYNTESELPNINANRVAIFIGSHKRFNDLEVSLIEKFCEKYNAALFVDHTSGYKGKYAFFGAIVACQEVNAIKKFEIYNPDLLIHLGEVSGDTYDTGLLKAKEVWRVSEDGDIKDLFYGLTGVFEMSEKYFFNSYCNFKDTAVPTEYFNSCQNLRNKINDNIPELPFGNIWCAQQMRELLPDNSVLYLAILNTLRSWNFFMIPNSIETSCNVGGFGIDGTLSTVIGRAIINPSKLFFCVLGDLSFFYDMNALGNRHVGNNLRILLINNGRGTEFTNYGHPAKQFGDNAIPYIAAEGHFGNKSRDLAKHYVTDLGFDYICASNKAEFLSQIKDFVRTGDSPKSIVFEIFTNPDDESDAIRLMRNISPDERSSFEKMKKETVDTSKRILSGIIHNIIEK